MAPEVTVRNVNSHNLGVLAKEGTTGRRRNRVMISRNTPLPANHTARFVTAQADQSSVVVNVVEGGDASGNDATRIGNCIVRNLPAGLPAGSPVEVAFRYGQNGRLTVKASVPGSGQEATSEIARSSGMTAETLRSWNQRLRNGQALLKPS